jgi:hypothetical protein
MVTIFSAIVSIFAFRFRGRAALYRIWPQVLDAMVLVKPATVVEWHRKGFRLYWRWRSRRPGRPRINKEIRDLIRRMSNANPLWGAPRIHGELLKLGIKISQATVGRCMPWHPKVPSPTWRIFLRKPSTRKSSPPNNCSLERNPKQLLT